ncbi:MAG: HAD hydrolase family protein [Gammaproteobacteria bacterium]|mgnify:FL=1|nr:HAD hydrolase family protein [Gammaproteobacteria bacterium]MBT4380270.1 HAD hydrolase family protein [Gammaproteobacteria bacterium]MBT4618448.1 HAD hydrolase family protein [Gammaproteobacteria bacterium]MBT5442607.1 HAD hydrolase family protein [Gammaproteobacteria bacterium]MBT5789271.1 HAD hydrolase family protein [Gammaproteobacteria bacterium]
MIFSLIDLCATLPSLLVQPEVSICMSDKLKALAIDLDGTLLVEESLSERNRRVIAAAYKKGYHIVVATARRLQPGFVAKLYRMHCRSQPSFGVSPRFRAAAPSANLPFTYVVHGKPGFLGLEGIPIL